MQNDLGTPELCQTALGRLDSLNKFIPRIFSIGSNDAGSPVILLKLHLGQIQFRLIGDRGGSAGLMGRRICIGIAAVPVGLAIDLVINRDGIVDQVREAQKQKNINAEFPDPPDPFDEIFLEEWRKTALEEAKDELRGRVDEKTWQAFEMYGLQNRDAKQVALILGITVNQLYVAKNRCTAMLKKIVKHHNEADPEARIEL